MLFSLGWIELFSFLIVEKLGFLESERHKTHTGNARIFLDISLIPFMRKDEIGAIKNKITVRRSFANTNLYLKCCLALLNRQILCLLLSPLLQTTFLSSSFVGENCMIKILLGYIPNQWISKGLFRFVCLFSFSTAGAKGCAIACPCTSESQWKRSLKSEGKKHRRCLCLFQEEI